MEYFPIKAYHPVHILKILRDATLVIVIHTRGWKWKRHFVQRCNAYTGCHSSFKLNLVFVKDMSCIMRLARIRRKFSPSNLKHSMCTAQNKFETPPRSNSLPQVKLP